MTQLRYLLHSPCQGELVYLLLRASNSAPETTLNVLFHNHGVEPETGESEPRFEEKSINTVLIATAPSFTAN